MSNKGNKEAQEKMIEAIAIDWVCPNNHNPTTPYEKGEVKKLIRFAKDIILALGYRKLPKDKPPLLVDIGGKDTQKAVNDLKSHKLSTLFSYRYAYFIGARAQWNICIKHYEEGE